MMSRPNRNLYLVTGHSFGGAVVLSALNEIFLERVAAATAQNPDDDCVKTPALRAWGGPAQSGDRGE